MDKIKLLEEQELEHNILKVNLDYKILSEEYSNYRKIMHRTLAKYQKTISGLMEERKDLVILLGSGTDPNLVKRSAKQRYILDSVVGSTKCVEMNILQLIELIRRDHVLLSDMDEKITRIKISYLGLAGSFQKKVKNLRKLGILRGRFQHANLTLDNLVASNKQYRIQIKDHKALKSALVQIVNKLRVQIATCKNKITELMMKTAHAIEEKEESQSMILALKTKDEKDKLLFEHTMRTLKMSMRCDQRSFDFLSTKINEKVDVMIEENKLKLQEIMNVLETDTRSLKSFKETLECIQEICDERDVTKLIQNFKQKEDENFALFKYITNLSGEVDELQEKKSMLEKEIDKLSEENRMLDQNHQNIMNEKQSEYRELSDETELYMNETLEICKQLDNIGMVVSNMFRGVGCKVASVEPVLGLNLKIRTQNLVAYLAEVERQSNVLLDSYHYMSMKEREQKGMSYPSRFDIGIFECQQLNYANQSIPTPIDKEYDNVLENIAQLSVLSGDAVRLKATENLAKHSNYKRQKQMQKK